MIPPKMRDFKNPDFREIPDIPLYMDQLLDYLKSHLNPLLRTHDDSVFTKTMVNNYVKSSVIESPIKKKYSRESISDLILVYHLKQSFSIQDTSAILNLIKESNTHYYQSFIETHEKILGATIDSIPETEDKSSAVEFLIQLSIEASIKKQMAEQLLDHLQSNEIIKQKPDANHSSE